MKRDRRWIRLAQAGIAGIALGTLVIGSLPPRAYNKDLQVEYLTAWALRDGVDIFTPVNELSARYFPAPSQSFPHPSPHPPVLALISLPMTLVPFPVLALLWLALNVALLILIGRWLGLSVQASLPLAAWPPVWWVLYLGQYELILLVMALLGWRAAARGQDWRAGMWLGVATAIKFYPAVFLLSFVVRRRWRLILSAGLVVGLSQLGSLAAVGVNPFLHYYTDILPTVSAGYAHIGLNSSPYGALLRLFGGSTDVIPLISAPVIVVPATVVISLLALAALLKLEPEAAPAVALVALPQVWFYQAVMALPELVALVRTVNLRRAALVAGLAMSLVVPLLNNLLSPILQAMQWSGTKAPPFAGVLAAIPPLGGVLLLILALARAQQGTTEPKK